MKVTLEYIKKRFKGDPVVKCALIESDIIRINSDSIYEDDGCYWAYWIDNMDCQCLYISESKSFAEIIKQQEIVIPKENTKYSDLIRELSNLEGKVLITSEKIGNKFIYTIEEID